MIDVAEVSQWRWLEECTQWLENVDQTHLALASGKPVLFSLNYMTHWCPIRVQSVSKYVDDL